MKPQIGETWEIKLPHKPKQIKILSSRFREWRPTSFLQADGRGALVWAFAYLRKSKGRYSAITERALLQYGKKIAKRPRCKCGKYPANDHDGVLICKQGHPIAAKE